MVIHRNEKYYTASNSGCLFKKELFLFTVQSLYLCVLQITHLKHSLFVSLPWSPIQLEYELLQALKLPTKIASLL